MIKNKIVYRHRRLDTNEIFYVGIGSLERAFSKKGRNNLWKKVVNKAGYNVEIIADDLSWEDACELEIFLIQNYGRRDLKTGSLVNMTDGGEGRLNHISEKRGIPRTEEDIMKIKNGMIGFCLTPEQRILSNLNKPRGKNHHFFGNSPMKGKTHSDESRRKMSGKIIECTITKLRWYTVKDCADYSGINRNTLKSRLNGLLKNNTTFIYVTDDKTE